MVRGVEWLLFFHLLGAFFFVAGAVVAGVLQVAAMRRELPSEVALLLRLTRVGVLLVGLGALMTLGFGMALANKQGWSLGAGWISASLGLWVAAMALGGAGGRTARHARYLAERLAREDNRPSEELRGLVADRPALVLSYLSSACVLAIIVLMVWKPGA
jgi:uncharacterized membrane protein